MHLSKVVVKNYRCLADVDIPLDKYTAFIGPNGAEKSSILYALDWFLGGRGATHDDLTWQTPDTSFEVSVCISELSENAREFLGEFGRGPCATFTRQYDSLSNTSSYWGRALVGPGFYEVLGRSGIANIRSAYRSLQDKLPELRELTRTFSLDDIKSSFREWESDPNNLGRLVAYNEVDAGPLFVPNGPMCQLIQFVLIKGSTDLSTQLNASGRTSTLSVLTEKLVTSARKEALAEWKDKHSDDLQDLEQLTSSRVEAATTQHQHTVNEALKQYLPNAQVQLRSSNATVNVTNDAPITTMIHFSKGEDQDIAAQGHGTQRAVMMAMVQSLAEVNRAEDSQGSLLIIAAEEPDIYQHPTRAKYFARALSRIAGRDGAQVLVATHSAFFVRPEHIPNLRKVQLKESYSSVHWTSAARIARKLGKTDYEVSRKIEKEVPGAFSEGLFSHSVVLVEGDTDKVVLEVVADHLDLALDAESIAVFPVGSKTDFKFYYEILSSLDIPTFVIFDGDYDSAARKHPEDQKKQSDARESNQLQTEACLCLLGLVSADGSPSVYQFGDPSWFGDSVAILQDRIETEIGAWKSFCDEMRRLHAKLDGKNAFAYRLAAQNADSADIPKFLCDVVQAIHQHALAHR